MSRLEKYIALGLAAIGISALIWLSFESMSLRNQIDALNKEQVKELKQQREVAESRADRAMDSVVNLYSPLRDNQEAIQESINRLRKHEDNTIKILAGDTTAIMRELRNIRSSINSNRR
jgi:hypothetical protein